MSNSTPIRCPVCDENDLTVITYALHSLVEDSMFGPQFHLEMTSDEFAIKCYSCGWECGNVSNPDLNEPIGTILERAKKDRIEHLRKLFIEEARKP